MSTAGMTQRLPVFVVFAALAAAGFVPLLRVGPGEAVVQPAELDALEKSLLAGARLHAPLSPPPPAAAAVYCAGCHPLPAHGGRRVADAMANEHAARMDCLVCHWSSSAGARPSPAWKVQSGRQFLAVLPADRSSPEQLGALRAAVTASRRCFERGPDCAGCHRAGGMAGLLRPGTAPARAAALGNLERYFTLAPGEKWYFPQLQ